MWTIVDDGLSRNGTFVNGQRVIGRVRLHDRDEIRVGVSVLTYCAPEEPDGLHTLIGEPLLTAARLTAAQRAVLVALCRPGEDASANAVPQVRCRAPAAEPEASPPRRDGAGVRSAATARALTTRANKGGRHRTLGVPPAHWLGNVGLAGWVSRPKRGSSRTHRARCWARAAARGRPRVCLHRGCGLAVRRDRPSYPASRSACG